MSVRVTRFQSMSGTREQFAVRRARIEDREAMLALMPRLAVFDVPASRARKHLWMSDARMFERRCAGEEDACLVQVAVNGDGDMVGLAWRRCVPSS